jgi:HD-GYP domain-containing protein (c-di-GMP phosphodiesterase class II)
MTMRRKYPLQTTISLLFIVISLALGLLLSAQSFNKTSDILRDAAIELHDRISHELALDIKANYGSIRGGLSQFRLSPVISAQNFVQRSQYLPTFKAIIDNDKSIFSVGIGYADGDYLGFLHADSEHIQAKYKVPAAAAYVVQYLKGSKAENDFATAKLYNIYYDSELNEISRNQGQSSRFDPRSRPWYQQATDAPQATKPYLFYDSKIVGLTAMSKTTEPGVVVVFDITLQNLSNTIARYKMTASSEIVLINAEGQTFAYKDQSRVIVGQQNGAETSTQTSAQNELKLAHMDQLGSGVLSFVSKTIKAEEKAFDFDYNGQHWIASTQVVAKPGGVDLYALMLSPEDELLQQAFEIRWQLIVIALIVLLAFIPVIWFAARKISTPLNELSSEAEAIAHFDFARAQLKPSFIKEVAELDQAMEMMKTTINKFITLINSLAGEQNLDVLIQSITRETMLISQSDAALIYLKDDIDDRLKANFLCDSKNQEIDVSELPELSALDAGDLLTDNTQSKSRVIELNKINQNKLTALLDLLSVDSMTNIILPLKNRNDEIIGLLCLLFDKSKSEVESSNIEFVEALSGFAAVTLESRQLFNMQEALLHSFIKLIAGAIDAKSPYTGGHCKRVPEITLMLAQAACDSEEEKFKDFSLTEKQWEELSIAGWLHDCGKVTTPEYVVDKATKLETIYDRIHEVRMRFEVMKRDVEISCWQQIAAGGDKKTLIEAMQKQHQQLDDDFLFVAECNVGGEYMADDKITRLQHIAVKTWQRTIDDRAGLSWEELNRKAKESEPLPVQEKLLADKPEHLIARHESDKIPDDNLWGFKVDTPEHKYNRGELYNLSVKKGTLSEEERYMINAHMIQTIMMLNKLPFPKHLRNVPQIAGSHHETMDGKGYPKKLVMSEQPITARMMVIADIFEALTASDRPYKKAKTLSESLRILSFMRNDKHIDADLFDLFLRSGVYLQYADKFLSAEQIDDVNIDDYLSS